MSSKFLFYASIPFQVLLSANPKGCNPYYMSLTVFQHSAREIDFMLKFYAETTS